jgi:hypothetical protein
MNNFFVTTSRLEVLSFFCHTHIVQNTSPGEAFKLYLGIDHGIKVDFKPVVSKSGTSGMLKKSTTESVTHTTVITNHKPYEVTISRVELQPFQVELVVWDQLPFAEDSTIKVKVEEPNLKVCLAL